MAPLLTAGRHLLLRVGSILAVLSGATAIAARVDEPTLAAHQIAASLLLFLALALDALAIPAQTLVAEQLGRDSTAEARRLSDRVVRLSIIAGAGARRRRRRVGATAPPRLHRRRCRRRPGHRGAVVDGRPARAGGHRLRLRRRADRRRRLPLPRAGRRGLPDRRRAARPPRAAQPAPASPASGRRSASGWSLRATVNHHRAQRLLDRSARVKPGQPSAGPRRLGRGLRSAPR